MGVKKDVLAFIRAEAAENSITKPMVLVMDCGCMLDQESVLVDIREEREEPGYEFYFVKEGISFLVSPKIRRLADDGTLGVVSYGGGRFRRLEFFPAAKPR